MKKQLLDIQELIGIKTPFRFEHGDNAVCIMDTRIKFTNKMLDSFQLLYWKEIIWKIYSFSLNNILFSSRVFIINIQHIFSNNSSLFRKFKYSSISEIVRFKTPTPI